MLFGFIELNIYVILSLATAFLLLNIGLVVLLGNKDTYAKAFAAGSFFAALWSAVGALYLGATNVSTNFSVFFLENINRATYYIGLLVALSFFYFCYRFPNTKDTGNKILWLLILFAVATWPLFAYSNLIIGGFGGWTTSAFDRPAIIAKLGPFILLYTITFIGLFASGVSILFRKSKTEKDPVTKKHLRFMFWTIVIGFVPAGIFNVVFPVLNMLTYTFTFLGIIASSIWVFFCAYTIIRYKQMNVRVVSTELLIVLAIFILFVAIFI